MLAQSLVHGGGCAKGGFIIAIGALGGLMFGAGTRDSGKTLQTVGAYQSLDSGLEPRGWQ